MIEVSKLVSKPNLYFVDIPQVVLTDVGDSGTFSLANKLY